MSSFLGRFSDWTKDNITIIPSPTPDDSPSKLPEASNDDYDLFKQPANSGTASATLNDAPPDIRAALERIVILPFEGHLTIGDVEAACPGPEPIYACDFYIEGAEKAEKIPSGGFRVRGTWNIDHHAPAPEMAQRVTSTMLATRYLKSLAEQGTPMTTTARVVINHTDCDSVLSSAMLLGLIDPSEALVESSLRADHTGVEDPVADLLQGLDDERHKDRTAEQYYESIRNLKRLLSNEGLELAGQEALKRRRDQRASAALIIAKQKKVEENVVLLELKSQIDGALFAALIPEAAIIVLAEPDVEVPGNWFVKLRLGPAAPKDLTIDKLGITGFDKNYGGRWNAGSNKRGDGTTDLPLVGTTLSPKDYARRVRERLASYLSSMRHDIDEG